MPRRGERTTLSTPAGSRTRSIHVPSFIAGESFGRLAERIARNLGTARFLIVQTVLVICWITFNVVAIRLRFDPYPFILLNLAFSTQASYAAPLILLAQNRQEERDREQLERDREEARRTQADTEYLARELASIRIALADVVTNDDLDRALSRTLEGREGKGKKGKRRKAEDALTADQPSADQPSADQPSADQPDVDEGGHSPQVAPL